MSQPHHSNADDVVQSDIVHTNIPRRSPQFDDDDDYVITRLLASEAHHMPRPHHLRLPPVLTFRVDSINWILKASGWAYQLLAVACVSLAAKLEEPYVPLLIDLQVFETRCVFESKTIQRMELPVMANLNWRLRAVTPFDYLAFFISKLPSFGSRPDPFAHILPISSDLILNTTRVTDILEFSPSIIAAAAMISAAGESVDLPEIFYERVNKEMVRSCHQLMEEHLVDTCQSKDPKERTPIDVHPAAPSSPSDVLDVAACVSCDTRLENPAA